MTEPTGLPPVDGAAFGEQKTALEKSRVCPDCGKETRIFSNHTGVKATCNTCKKTWSISMMPMNPPVPHSPPRGLHKQTLVQPDWDKAYDEIGESSDEDVRRPKKR
jgi:hypothetical protein